MLKFKGLLDDLKRIVMRCAIPGEWSFHKKNRFYRFQVETGSILNWWPTTGTINFQGQDAEQFEALFLKHALAEAAQSEPGLIGEESAWEHVPSPTPTPDGTRGSPILTGTKNLREASQRLGSRTFKLLAAPGRD